MNCSPKISITVPIYNVEPYLRKCLDSLVNQTLEDIEIICINDCSPDNCLVILNEYAEKDNRIKIIDFEKNQGVSVARNTGIKTATGKYIGFCDPDDYVDLDFFKRLYEKAEDTGADIAHSNVKQKELNDQKEYILFPYKTGTIAENLMIFWQCIYKTDLLRSNEIEFPLNIISPGEDHCFLVKALIYANKKEFVQDVFYHYIINSNSFVSKPLHIESVYQLPQFCMAQLLNSSEISIEFYLKIFRIFFYRFIQFYHRFTAESKSLMPSGFEQYCRLCKYQENFGFSIPVSFFVNCYSNAWLSISSFIKANACEGLFFYLKNEQEKKAYPQISIKQKVLECRKLYVWGTGKNGLDALIQCDNNGWKVEAFLDSNQQVIAFQGYNVLQPQKFLESKNRDFFIVISSTTYANEIAKNCEQAGFKEGEDFWKPNFGEQ